MKRMIDITLAALGLAVLSPLLAVVAAAVWFADGRPIIFAQERFGRGFRRFRIFKFRTMVVGATENGLATGEDARVTRIGRFLRASKLDELPQLLNVLRGDMSLVGPRPELPRYVEFYRAEYRAILRVRPGMTDLASLLYRNEAQQLAESPDPEAEYVGTILPDKIRLGLGYVRRASLGLDLWLMAMTVRCLLIPKRIPKSVVEAPRRRFGMWTPSPLVKS